MKTDREPAIKGDPRTFRYIDSDEDGVYEMVRYVDYGMWLKAVTTGTKNLGEIPGSDVKLGLERRAYVVGYHEPAGAVYSPGNSDSDAMYAGTAAGLSAHTDDDGVTASGHFEADVSLTATFSATKPGISGTITNFRPALSDQGDKHVSDQWVVGLGAFELNASLGGNGDTNVNNQGSGEWSTRPYGTAQATPEQPEGFYGFFNAEFTDGAVAGIYDAKKQ